MNQWLIACEVLASLGGQGNILANSKCMTRLRVIVDDAALIDAKRLSATKGVLGIVRRNGRGVEVVFGPTLIDGVFDEFSRMTGISSKPSDFEHFDSAPVSTIQVQVSPARRRSFDERADALAAASNSEDDDDSSFFDDEYDESILRGLLEDETMGVTSNGKRLLVLNGPNINLLGLREPEIYGHQDYATLLKSCSAAAHDAGFSDCVCMQSNHEGDLVDAIQDAIGTFDAIVINPAAYTHTSVALYDAVKAVRIPTVEVHLSDVDDREEFRKVSYIRPACLETVSGLGFESYTKAIFDLAKHLGIKGPEE